MILIPYNYAYNFYIELSAFMGFQLHTLGIYVALGSFTFISGFGLYLQRSNRSINTFEKLITFLKRRFFRIFPLYWIALIIFLFIFDFYADLDLVYLIAHFFGLQIIFAPIFGEPIWTLWFISLIMIYYLIFIFLSYLNSLKKIIPGSLIILAFFLFLRSSFGLVEIRFFMYYPLFIIGIITARIYTSLQAKRIKEYLNNKHTLLIPGIISVCMVISWLSYPHFVKYCYIKFNSTYHITFLEAILEEQGSFIEFFNPILLVTTIILVFICFILSFAYLIFTGISLISDGIKIRNIVSLVAYSTYGVYLFHRPYLIVFDDLMLEFFNINMYLKSNFYLILLSIPILFVLAFLIQKIFDDKITIITNRLSRYFTFSTATSSIKTEE